MFVSKCRLWKLREAYNEIVFKRRVEVKEDSRSEDNIDQIWDRLRQCVVKEAEAVCGRSKGPPRHRETWWWNDERGERNRRLFLMWKNSKPGEEKKNEEAYRKANKQVKRIFISKQKMIINKNFLRIWKGRKRRKSYLML